ncbi:adenylate/guanylate cyclase domain-containing protein [Massilia forsythiae]|uniref:Adenylate/guanylate cyclase domain-containing protein n=2 Tax=Massilia forsythiae TaxID=2728020 RepID=A0A7Z2ZV84_9BURK|nr:adenylate/guanylate cyclase domain-containing protein [Massilia forsythiae]
MQWGQPTHLSFVANEWLRDAFLRVRVSDAPEPRVLVVDIDEASLARRGPWPWPRERLADLVEILLSRYEARGVALDILLPEASATMAGAAPRTQAASTAGDLRLALLARHGPVVPAQAFDFDLARLRPEPIRDGHLGGAVDTYTGGIEATGYIANYPALAQAPHVGAIGFIPDPDGTLRRVPLITRYGGHAYPALALALVNCCAGQGTLALADTGLVRVGFERDWRAYTVASAADILDQSIDPASARGRLVLVGSSSLGMGDRVATPLAASRPGLGVQAAMLSTLLDRQAGRAPAPWPGRALALGWIALTALLVPLAFSRLSAMASVGLLGASSLAWLGLTFLATPHDPHFHTGAPLAANLFLLAVAVPYQWQLSQRRSRHLLLTLRQYVAPAVVAELLRSDLEDPLQPRQLDVTTLIADMEGYTAQVEALPVEEAAQLTRGFLDCLTGPVIERQGTLDKYTGDGLVAFWGAPLPLERHADLALDAALAILQRVREFSAARERRGHAPLRVRIGIESGAAMAGDFGTSFRSIYTAVGDSVNTASRLEQAARDYPHDVVIGPGTVARARRHGFLALGERRLRGKERPTRIFTFQDSMERSDSNMRGGLPSSAALTEPEA